jgi:hypothetical protein
MEPFECLLSLTHYIMCVPLCVCTCVCVCVCVDASPISFSVVRLDLCSRGSLLCVVVLLLGCFVSAFLLGALSKYRFDWSSSVVVDYHDEPLPTIPPPLLRLPFSLLPSPPPPRPPCFSCSANVSGNTF